MLLARGFQLHRSSLLPWTDQTPASLIRTTLMFLLMFSVVSTSCPSIPERRFPQCFFLILVEKEGGTDGRQTKGGQDTTPTDLVDRC